MRASAQEQTGGAGANEVAAAFERIGWGVAKNSEHDLGTDLFLMARDHRLIDLGMVVGAQVKTGPSFFKEVVRGENGDPAGWWFREPNRKHFDAWLDHQLPHIVVLHDLEKRTSYWAPITNNTVQFTEKGAKVFVPADNVVNAANAGRLLDVASSHSRPASWEGSAWSGAELSPTHQLRHALLAPRLIAPHPNRGVAVPPTAAQVLAMVVQARFFDIVQLRQQQASLPDLDNLSTDAEWDWRFVAGMHRFVTSGDPDVLREYLDGDKPTYEQAVATAAYAAALIEDGRAREAREVTEAVLSRDELDLVDQAWIQLQHARALSELGDRHTARDEVFTLVGLARRAPGDVTAAAIGGAAANTLLVVSDWDAWDMETTISAADTTASWWRQQVSGWGLSDQVGKAFRVWAGDRSITLGGSDTTWCHLRSASLLAGLLGDHGAWRHATGDLAIYLLSDRDHGKETDRVTSALRMLRRSGDHKELELAARRVTNGGPSAAARNAALEVAPSESTRTSALADLRLLIEAGDLLPAQRAEELMEWAQRTFHDPGEYSRRTRPGFLLHMTLFDLMSALIFAVGEQARQELADFILDLPAQQDQSAANRLSKLVKRLPARVWTLERAQRAGERADGDNWELTYPLLGAAALQIPHFRDRLKAEAHDGSLEALSALGDVRELGADLAQSLIAKMTGMLDLRIQQVARGQFGGGGHDVGRALAMLNIWYPQCANWEILYRLLGSTRWGEYLNGALNVLASSSDRLPEQVAAKLGPIVAAIAGGPPLPTAFLRAKDPRPAAMRLHAILERLAGELSTTHLSTLIRGTVDDRLAAAQLARDIRDDLMLGVLLVLAGDPEPRVRATAARAVADRAASGDVVARSHLRSLVEDEGILVGYAVAASVAFDHPQLREFDELESLHRHISSQVRLAFAGEL